MSWLLKSTVRIWAKLYIRNPVKKDQVPDLSWNHLVLVRWVYCENLSSIGCLVAEKSFWPSPFYFGLGLWQFWTFFLQTNKYFSQLDIVGEAQNYRKMIIKPDTNAMTIDFTKLRSMEKCKSRMVYSPAMSTCHCKEDSCKMSNGFWAWWLLKF